MHFQKLPVVSPLVLIVYLFSPLRNHVIKLEKLLVSMAKERKGQLEELFEMK